MSAKKTSSTHARSQRSGVGAITHAFLARGLPAFAVLGAAIVVGVAGLAFTRASVEREVYRERLIALSSDFESLRSEYNNAVRQTAVTELVVSEGQLSVNVRNATGRVATIETPYDPSREIFVDYAVIGGRVWIRRVFDQDTAPSDAVLIDPDLAEIDWDDEEAELGKTVYRSLAEGRWVISVSGNGGLGLRAARDDETIELAAPPEVRAFEEIDEEAARAAERVTLRDVISRVFGW